GWARSWSSTACCSACCALRPTSRRPAALLRCSSCCARATSGSCSSAGRCSSASTWRAIAVRLRAMSEREPRVPPGQGGTKGWPLLHVGQVPDTPPEHWRVSVGGAVERTLELSWRELLALPQTRVRADFHCVTGWSKLDNDWEGVRIDELARRAGARPETRF